MIPTMLAAAGVPDIKEKLLEGYQAGDKNFKLHLDGYNMLPYFKGEAEESPEGDLLFRCRRQPECHSLQQLETAFYHHGRSHQ